MAQQKVKFMSAQGISHTARIPLDTDIPPRNPYCILFRFIAFTLFVSHCLLSVAAAATDCTAVTQIPVIECEALLKFYHAVNGPAWENNQGWNQTNIPCDWHGIRCEKGHVSQVNLHDNAVSGTLPDLQLPNLTDLNLSNNQLTGQIPDFSNLPNLTELFLYNTQLTGQIPDFNLPKLEDIHLDGNQFGKPAPSRPTSTLLQHNPPDSGVAQAIQWKFNFYLLT
jgi:hypothetical protein